LKKHKESVATGSCAPPKQSAYSAAA